MWRARICSLAVILAAALLGGHVYPGDPETPAPLIGRWKMQKSLHLGEQQSLGETEVEIEFTSTQMHLRIWTSSEERPLKPTYKSDCYAHSAKGLLMLDMKTAAENPGPEKGLEVQCIYKFVGNELWICSGSSGDPKDASPRPAHFVSTPESKSDLYVLARMSSK